jgi:hypothetical protein
MADVLVGSEGSDVKRLAALFNRILGAETISLSPPVQMLCDAMIGARPDFLFAVNAQGTILLPAVRVWNWPVSARRRWKVRLLRRS